MFNIPVKKIILSLFRNIKATCTCSSACCTLTIEHNEQSDHMKLQNEFTPKIRHRSVSAPTALSLDIITDTEYPPVFNNDNNQNTNNQQPKRSQGLKTRRRRFLPHRPQSQKGGSI